MSIKCGNCQEYHDTVEEVRLCSQLLHPSDPVKAGEEDSAAAALDALLGEPTVTNPPSAKQVSYALDLLSLHEWPDELTKEDLLAMERRQVSRLISDIQTKPLKAQDGAISPKIPDGRYALKGAEGHWVFWEVETATRGRWRGYTFVKLLLGSPGDYRKERIGKEQSEAIIKRIEEVTPRQASMDFGLTSGTCGVCSSPLSNAESLKLGIGPVCRNKMGW